MTVKTFLPRPNPSASGPFCTSSRTATGGAWAGPRPHHRLHVGTTGEIKGVLPAQRNLPAW